MKRYSYISVLVLLLIIAMPLVTMAQTPTSSNSSAGAAYGEALPQSGANILWDQPVSAANTNGYACQDFESSYDEYDLFMADDFTNLVPWSIQVIFVPGNLWQGGTTLENATTLNWRIYKDAGGVPNGDPRSGGAFWSLSLPPTDPRVSISAGIDGYSSNVTLNLTTPITLNPGTYWLVFYPEMSFDTGGQYGRHVSDTINDNIAKVINPGGGFGFPAVWTNVTDHSTYGFTQRDLAFRLEGSAGSAKYSYCSFLTDLNGNGSKEVAVSRETGGTPNSSSVLIKDWKTGAILREIPCLDSRYIVKDIKKVDGLFSNSIPGLGILAVRDDGVVKVQLRDPFTGDLIRDVPFAKGYSPISMTVLKDMNLNGAPELAVLGTRTSDGKSQVQIRDAKTGVLIRNISVGPNNTIKCLDVVFMPDLNGNESQELAVLQRDDAQARIQAKFFDSLTGKPVKTIIFLKPSFTPLALSWMKDMNGNLYAELGLFALDSATGRLWVEIRDVLTGTALNKFRYSAGFSPKDFSSVALDENGTSKLGVLGKDLASGAMRIELRDPETGTVVKRIPIP